MTQYTKKQQAYINQNKDPSPSINVSFLPDKPLLIDLLILLAGEGKEQGFNSVSALMREAVMCLLHFGLDWRQVNSAKQMRDEIMQKLDNIGTVQVVQGEPEPETEKDFSQMGEGSFFE